MILVFSIIAGLGGLAIIASICLKTATADAGFSAAMGGSSGGSHRKGGSDELLEKIMKVAAVLWIVACSIIALLAAHQGPAAGLGG
jgi:protein translocase SecG subunit